MFTRSESRKARRELAAKLQKKFIDPQRIFPIAKFAEIVASCPEIEKCTRKNENPRCLLQVLLDSTGSRTGTRTPSIVTAGINPEELL